MAALLIRIRNSPNLAGVVLAVLAFIAATLILPMLAERMADPPSREARLGLSAAIAAFAYYKGRRAVEKRLQDNGN